MPKQRCSTKGPRGTRHHERRRAVRRHLTLLVFSPRSYVCVWHPDAASGHSTSAKEPSLLSLERAVRQPFQDDLTDTPARRKKRMNAIDQNPIVDPLGTGLHNRNHAIVRFPGEYPGRPRQTTPADNGGGRHRQRANFLHSGRRPEQLPAIAGKPAVDRIGAELLRDA